MHNPGTVGSNRPHPAPANLPISFSGPAVLLVHDWSGLPADMAPLAEELAAHHYRSVTMDYDPVAATLGGCARLSELADEIIAAAHRAGPVTAIVAHGLGASAVLLALSRERIAGQVVLVGLDPDHRNWAALTARLGDVPGLLIHSADDATAPLHDALEVADAWPNSILARVEGLGHRSVLTAPSTRQSVLRFLALHDPAPLH